MLLGLSEMLTEDLRKLWFVDSLSACLELRNGVFLGAVNVRQVLDYLLLTQSVSTDTSFILLVDQAPVTEPPRSPRTLAAIASGVSGRLPGDGRATEMVLRAVLLAST